MYPYQPMGNPYVPMYYPTAPMQPQAVPAAPATPVQQTAPTAPTTQANQTPNNIMSSPTPAPVPATGIIWVKKEEVEQYYVAPNNAVVLWDSENPVIYIKSADAVGLPSLKIIDYTIRQPVQNSSLGGGNFSVDNFVTRDEFAALQAKIDVLTATQEQAAKNSQTAASNSSANSKNSKNTADNGRT